MWIALILMAGIWSGVGMLAERYPETLAGYNTLSQERKQYVDIRATGRFCARLMYACCGITLAGLPALWFARGEAVMTVCLCVSMAVLLAGGFAASWKYDRKFLAGLKKRLGGGRCKHP